MLPLDFIVLLCVSFWLVWKSFQKWDIPIHAFGEPKNVVRHVGVIVGVSLFHFALLHNGAWPLVSFFVYLIINTVMYWVLYAMPAHGWHGKTE